MVEKERVIAKIDEMLSDRLTFLEAEMRSIQSSASGETKSSMGDKYETARAQAHLELEKLARRVSETRQLVTLLKQAELDTGIDSVSLGNLVFTSNGPFFIGCGLGKITLGDSTVFAVSTASPIARMLLNRKVGDSITLNGKSIQILKIEG